MQGIGIMNAGVLMKRGKPVTDLTPASPRMDGPTPEQLAQGGYSRKMVLHGESNTFTSAHVSRHDPIERWKASERLSQGQLAAIELCRHLWNLTGLQQRVTASYGERQPPSHNIERRALSIIEATEDLYRIQDYVPSAYWQLFQNVARFGEPAEIAGERLNFGKRSAADRAHQVVCFVADIISSKEGL